MAQPDRPPSLIVAYLVTALAFAAAYGQGPLFYSNQNQYFLHGLGAAGRGHLSGDWLANTLDPTPVFSGLVAATAQTLPDGVFHAYHALLHGLYAAALLGLFVALAGREVAARRWPVFALLLVLVHSAAARWASQRLLGEDYPWYFQAGVAGQYVLGAMFQPSAFGVLLVAAVACFANNRPLLAAVCVGAACTAHATYLLAGAALTLGFLAGLWRAGRPRLALGVAGLTLALVLPVVAYALLTFAPTSAADFAESQRILAHDRIPHHCLPQWWLDGVAAVQLGWAVLGVALTWGTRLFPALATPLTLGGLLTAAQAVTGSDALALLFPWRVFAVLVPVATAVVLARLVARMPVPDGRTARAAAVAGLAALAACGVWISAGRHAFRTPDEEEREVLQFVSGHARPGDVYLVPVRLPRPSRGSASSDFRPLPAKRVDARVIPLDLQRFRLHAGAPVYVDFKSIPYKDVEVIEWRRRLGLADRVQGLLRGAAEFDPAALLCGAGGPVWLAVNRGLTEHALDTLRAEGVSHVVWPAAVPLSVPALRPIHADLYYRVYRLEVATDSRGE